LFGVQVSGKFGACDEPPGTGNATTSGKQNNYTSKPSYIQFSEGELFEISLVVVLVATLFGILNVKIE